MVYFFDSSMIPVDRNANPTHGVSLCRLPFSPGGGPDYAASAGTPQGQGKLTTSLRSSVRPCVNPSLASRVFFVPREKNKGRGPHFLFCTSCLCSFEISFRTKGVCMSDHVSVEIERVETYEREESRFEQKGSKTFSCSDVIFLFPRVLEDWGVTTYDISKTACQFGIQTPVHISSGLYFTWIMNGITNPIKNIETLCHAFLYAVDCDMKDSSVLDFIVPGNGTPSYTASAMLHGFRVKVINLSWEP
jgi:hypothetical protein